MTDSVSNKMNNRETTQRTPKVSIIVPIYNVEKFLAKCLDSIICQSYENLEIICVDDVSPDDSSTILNKYAEMDSRIKIVSYEKNRGLFHARLAGAEVATGDYICFVDADDQISVDWIRLLVQRALEEQADMVMANTVQVDNNGYFVENNHMSLCCNRPSVCGEEIFDIIMKDEGLNFAWHTVWNKLYSIELWKKCEPDFSAIEGHLIMAEDIAYSVVLYYHSQKMAFSNHDAYFYYRHQEASTSANISLTRLKKNISDIIRVFKFFEAFLRKYNVYDRYEKEFLDYKARNFRIYCNILFYRNLTRNKEFTDLLLKGFGFDKLEPSHTEDFYFYDIRTPWESNVGYTEKIKKQICDLQIECVSFDLFDTLALRPFCNPSRLFDFIELKYADFFERNEIISFKKMRQEAENICRNRLRLTSSNYEDCTLEEIYNTLVQIYGLDSSLAEELKNIEEQTDLAICSQRKFAKSLYDLAGIAGKKRIIITDTYYDRVFIEKILDKIGITNYDGLFISSEKRKLKATGGLFRCALKELRISASHILHLGDNWESDILKSRECGLNSFFIGKTTEIFENKHSGDNYTGDVHISKTPNVSLFIDTNVALSQTPMDSYLALVANNNFDKPYPTWNRELRYNANFYFIGNYVFGGEMLGISSKLLKICKENGYKEIIFLARDGYLPKIAFDILNKKLNAGIKTTYFYVSRKALMPFMIEKANSVRTLQECIEFTRHQPASIVDMFADYINDIDGLKKELKIEHINFESNFANLECFDRFATVCDKYFDFALLKQQNAPIRQKITAVFSGDCLSFDLGYSGRIQSILCDVVGKPLDVFFVHSSGLRSHRLAQKNKFKIYEYLQYSPQVTSIVREYFFSEQAPSCIGYKMQDGRLTPVFEKKEVTEIERYMFGELIRGMSDLINDYCDRFADCDFMFDFRNSEISMPFEAFLNLIPRKDLYAFRLCATEDMFFWNYDKAYLTNTWEHRLNSQIVGERIMPAPQPIYSIAETEQFRRLSRMKRALVLFFADRKLFRSKLKNAFRRRKKK